MSNVDVSLKNIETLVQQGLSDGEGEYGAPSLALGLVYALPFADELIPLAKNLHLCISAFDNPKDSGLFFMAQMNGACCKVMSHPIAGGVMMYLGKRTDFAFPSRLASDLLEPICFDPDEIAKYVKIAAEHLAQRFHDSEEDLSRWRKMNDVQFQGR